ncbi:sensor domain-containing diguanylate cyclase [Desulfofustis glycolicus]|uniref:diguanylate cyclase n=1 Tax=Desulfofustis glycolicus DSM 9705 TaxID=1121409 RepID=A0A1M5W990_9BACT|nr:GGDEF domain-containing protein [Desulfofustis glycolicus]SHH84092.1 diguanylate cyclase (GGDEF) domain-containing protein [Desulfofustis glycolicus DSM 9705]
MTKAHEFFDGKIKLPSPPAVAIKILDAVRHDNSSFNELADIIKVDPALSSQLLKIANSSLYGLPNRVDSLSQATALIGTQALKNIALSFVIIQGFQNSLQGSFDFELFWRRAITAAVAAEVLAASLNHKDPNIFVSGLLQDIGVLVLFLSDAASFTELLDKKRISGKSLCETEKEHFGFDHTEVGSQLLKAWNLPDTIIAPIRSHHQEEDGPYIESAAILCFADKISALYHGIESNRKAFEIHEELRNTHQFQDTQIDELIDQVGMKAREVMEHFQIQPGEMKPFSQIMQEANEELGRLNLSYQQIVFELKQAKQNAEQLAVDLKRANDSLRELAFRDELTGLYNHRYFQEIFEAELQKSKRYRHALSLLLLDIDHFKRVNDTYGHLVGDHVLKQVSQIMIKLVRHFDIVARYGGEEFAIVLPETGKVGANVLAQRVRRGIEQCQLNCVDHVFSITTSIGVASTDMAAVEVDRATLIDYSDQALYKAKQNGRNRVELFRLKTGSSPFH